MAWMRSESTGNWVLTGEFTIHRFSDRAQARMVSEVLGFGSSKSSSEAIKAEMARVTGNREALVAEFVQGVIAALPPAITAPGVDLQPVLDKLDQILAAIALIPTAGQNGEASRQAIIKD